MERWMPVAADPWNVVRPGCHRGSLESWNAGPSATCTHGTVDQWSRSLLPWNRGTVVGWDELWIHGTKWAVALLHWKSGIMEPWTACHVECWNHGTGSTTRGGIRGPWVVETWNDGAAERIAGAVRCGLGARAGAAALWCMKLWKHGTVRAVALGRARHGRVERWTRGGVEYVIRGSMEPWSSGSRDPWSHGTVEAKEADAGPLGVSMERCIRGGVETYVYGSKEGWIRGE